jgi:GNAT superfamily N-acetyltransferase
MQPEDLNTSYLFDKDDSLIKKLIKYNGILTCRDEFDRSYINWCLENFTCGFANVGLRAQIGQKKKGILDRYILRGFVLFFVDIPDNEIKGRVFCVSESFKHQNIGLELLNSVKDFAFHNRISLWRISSLPYPKLLNYYTEYGFTKGHEKFDNKGNLKVIEMFMYLEILRDDNTCKIENEETSNDDQI